MQSLADKLIGKMLYDVDHHRVGRIHELYIDENTRRPTWFTVATGWFGTKEAFVPLGLMHLMRNTLVVDARKEDLKHAPHVRSHKELTPDEQRSLGNYYKNLLARLRRRSPSDKHYAF